VLNRASLETRLSNLQAAGYQAEVTAAVLKGWPSSSADLPGDGVPAHAIMQSADRQEVAVSPDVEGRAAPRTRLIVHGKLVTTDQHLECVIVDLSATGAQLSLETSVAAPPVALLHLANGLVHAVQCRWQRDTLAATRFSRCQKPVISPYRRRHQRARRSKCSGTADGGVCPDCWPLHQQDQSLRPPPLQAG
jgi:hypothetical protein